MENLNETIFLRILTCLCVYLYEYIALEIVEFPYKAEKNNSALNLTF